MKMTTKGISVPYVQRDERLGLYAFRYSRNSDNPHCSFSYGAQTLSTSEKP
jgi:hypothetical protein